MSDLRNWLERVAGAVPGYKGYAERERRRDADKLHREHLAERLRALKAPLNDAARELTAAGRLREIGAADRVLKKIDHAENRIRFASYGYAGFFDAARVEEAQLEALYHFDQELLGQVEEIARLLGEYQGRVAQEGALPGAELERAVDQLNETFDRRREVIEKFGRPDAAGGDGGNGRPLFGS